MTKAPGVIIRYHFCKPETLQRRKGKPVVRRGRKAKGPLRAAGLPAAGTGTKRTVPMQASVSVNGHRSP